MLYQDLLELIPEMSRKNASSRVEKQIPNRNVFHVKHRIDATVKKRIEIFQVKISSRVSCICARKGKGSTNLTLAHRDHLSCENLTRVDVFPTFSNFAEASTITLNIWRAVLFPRMSLHSILGCLSAQKFSQKSSLPISSARREMLLLTTESEEYFWWTASCVFRDTTFK